MDRKTEGELGRLLYWLRSQEDISHEQQLQIFFFLGVSSTAARLKHNWLGTAPAHPDHLFAWLRTKLDAAARRLSGAGYGQLHDFNLNSLARLAGPITAVSRPDHWLLLAAGSVPYWGIRLTGDAEKFLVVNNELADFLSAMSPSSVRSLQIAASGGRAKALNTQRLTWTWPLTIAVADEDSELRSVLQKAAPTAAYQFKTLDRQASASLVFVSGDIEDATRRLSAFTRNRFAYIVITGKANNIRDLIELARNHNVAGVIALGLDSWDAPARTQSLDRLFRSFEHSATLDRAADTGMQMTHPVVYGHPSALQRTTISHNLHQLMSSVSTKAENALFRVRHDVPSLGLQNGDYNAGDLLIRLQSRPGSMHEHEFAALVTLLGEIEAQLDEHPDRPSADRPNSYGPDLTETVTAFLNSRDQNDFEDDAFAFGSTTVNPPFSQIIGTDDRNDLALVSDNAASSARVQAQLLANGRQLNSLRPGQDATVRIWISPLLSDRAVHANQEFPLDELGHESRHELQLAFIPLKGTPMRGKAQVKSGIFVMATGELPPAHFNIVTDTNGDEYRARILVIHRNRVIQSILFTAVISETMLTEPRLQLIVENDVKPNFGYLRGGSQFDLSLVLNHNDENQAGIIAVRPNRVSFREPEGNFEKSIQSIKSILWSLNSAWDPHEEEDPEHLEEKLRNLARHGNILRDALFGSEPDLEVFSAPKVYRPDNPLRLQVVEAKAGAYLPVEFFYDFPSPSADARVCAKYRLGGFPGVTCIGCQDRGKRTVICPVGFWGISRVIERRPKDSSLPSGAAYECSEPLGDRERLLLTAQALLGSSEKVRSEDNHEISQILARRGTAPLQASCWTTWSSQVQTYGPSLLVAIAHTEVDPDSDILSLEIRKSRLLVCDIESELVRRQDEENPVVLLLGCQTKFADEPLQSAAARFKQKGAALVISTVATMRGKQAPACVAALIDEIDSARGMSTRERKKGMATVGMVMLRAKQKLIASGHAIGMCLTANGDSEWHF